MNIILWLARLPRCTRRTYRPQATGELRTGLFDLYGRNYVLPCYCILPYLLLLLVATGCSPTGYRGTLTYCGMWTDGVVGRWNMVYTDRKMDMYLPRYCCALDMVYCLLTMDTCLRQNAITNSR